MAGEEQGDHLIAQLPVAHALAALRVSCEHVGTEQRLVRILGLTGVEAADDVIDDDIQIPQRVAEAQVPRGRYPPAMAFTYFREIVFFSRVRNSLI